MRYCTRSTSDAKPSVQPDALRQPTLSPHFILGQARSAARRRLTLTLGLAMPLRDIETEDIVLVTSVALTAIAIAVEELYGSTAFKAVKIIGVVLSLGLAIHRIRMGKPYFKELSADSWTKVAKEFQVVIPKAEHKRGKYPTGRCLAKGADGSHHECLVGSAVNDAGDLIVSASQPVAIRVEVRK